MGWADLPGVPIHATVTDCDACGKSWVEDPSCPVIDTQCTAWVEVCAEAPNCSDTMPAGCVDDTSACDRAGLLGSCSTCLSDYGSCAQDNIASCVANCTSSSPSDCGDSCTSDSDCTSSMVCAYPTAVAPNGYCTSATSACGGTDSDNDGYDDCVDGCPNDAGKIEPGQCGCNRWDGDSDGDGLANCLDIPAVALPASSSDAVTPIPGYEPGYYETCDPALALQTPLSDGDGYEEIILRSGVDAEGCSASEVYCTEDGVPIGTPSLARINAAPASTSSCPAISGTSDPQLPCGLDPSTAYGTCTQDADCAAGELCGQVCTSPSCVETLRRCGSPFESCSGLPAEDDCEDGTLYQCPDPRDVGSISAAEVGAGLNEQRTPQPSIVLPDGWDYFVPDFYDPATDSYCTGMRRTVPQQLEQGSAEESDEGNDKWGVFVEPGAEEYFNLAPLTGNGEGQWEVGGGVSLAAGARVAGNRIEALRATVSTSVGQCGLSLGADLKIMGDAIVVLDSQDGLSVGFTPQGTAAENAEVCNAKFAARNQEARDLKGAAITLLEIEHFAHGAESSEDLCLKSNNILSTALDCSNAEDIKTVNILNAWKEEYAAQRKDFLEKSSEFEFAKDLVAGDLRLNLIGLGERFSLGIDAEANVSLGPITITVAFDAYGFWKLTGSMRAGLALDLVPSGLEDLVDDAPSTGNRDPRGIAGVIVTPELGFSVLAFAGIGIPGVSLGIEGQLDLLTLKTPFDVHAGMARETRDDPRTPDNPPDEELGGGKSYRWNTGWGYGGQLHLQYLSGKISLAARIKILFYKKTFRLKLVDWDGFEHTWVLFGDESGAPLVGDQPLGVTADKVGYTYPENIIAPTDAPAGSTATYPERLSGTCLY